MGTDKNVYEITQSLISSWLYMLSAPETVAEDAENDLVRKILRLEETPSIEQKNGLQFEAEVYKEANGETRTPHVMWEPGIKKVAEVLKGAFFQVKLRNRLTVFGRDFELVGIPDAIKAGTIYDVKFLNKSFNSAYLPGKYLDSCQHSAYFELVPEADTFIYLVSDGQDLYTETYRRDDTPDFSEFIEDFVDYLMLAGLWENYAENWKVKE